MNPQDNPSDTELLHRIARELTDIREKLTKSINAEAEAESEIHEKMRRFANYFHDIVYIKGEYHSLGLKAPAHIDREMERCDDRFRQLLDEAHTDGGTFEKVRRQGTVLCSDRHLRVRRRRLVSQAWVVLRHRGSFQVS